MIGSSHATQFSKVFVLCSHDDGTDDGAQQRHHSFTTMPKSNTDRNETTAVEGIYFFWINANGITHRVASTDRRLIPPPQNDHCNSRTRACKTATTPRAHRRHLILFLHGWPESWYSWRHQLLSLKDNPSYLAVAPDMRGYGSTTTPCPVLEEYTQPALANDVMGIADALGYDQFIVVGHDWGSQLAWTVALLYPERILGVCGMSVPYAGTPQASFLTMLQAKYGKCLFDEDDNGRISSSSRKEREAANFHYILHHCLPRVAEEYDKNCRELLYRLYGYHPGCPIEPGTPEVDLHGLMFPPSGDAKKDCTRVLDATASPGLWCRTPRPTRLPSWMTERDLDYYVHEFERAGFAGGLLYYKALDSNFNLMKSALRRDNGSLDDKIRPPALFVTGEKDEVIHMYGGMDTMLSKLKAAVPNMIQEPIILIGCGHWIQQESPTIVNEALLTFFSSAIAKAYPVLSKL
jgi:pimeloyl-ACP methyl ester carboxylesterase